MIDSTQLNMLRLLLLFPFLVLISSISLEQNEVLVREGKDYALFFAVDNYSQVSSFDNLRNPISDAEALASELSDMFGFETEIHRNPSKQDIYNVLRRYRQRSFPEDGQLFVFFSGHGDFDDFETKGYFIPASGPRIDLPTLGNIVTQIPCKHTLLAIDACYSGTIDQEIAFRGRGVRPGASSYDERQRLIDNLLRNKSRLLITSGGKERTPDGDEHSPFVGGILDGLQQAYTGGDGLSTFSDLLGELERVRPRPYVGELKGHTNGSYVFVVNDDIGLVESTNQDNSIEVNRLNIDQTPSIDDEMVFIPGGTFQMGDFIGDQYKDQKPSHLVKISSFFLSQKEVSVNDFEDFIDESKYITDAEKNGKSFVYKNDRWKMKSGITWICNVEGKVIPRFDYDHPVIHVSWLDALVYCNWRSKKEKLEPVYQIIGRNVVPDWEANGYRLPTEAEWEYAARSLGKDYYFAWGNGEPNGNISDEAAKNKFKKWSNYWVGFNDEYVFTAPVGTFAQGDIGLFDMSGNVWEWCWDFYDSNYYQFSTNEDPKGPDKENWDYRVIRGGSWFLDPLFCTTTSRGFNRENTSDDTGFRLARNH